MDIFSLMLVFILNFNSNNLTATVPGDYYEATNVVFAPAENKTCGVFHRYYVAPSGQKQIYFGALRCAPGNVTAKVLDAGLWRAHGIQSVNIN